MTNLDKLFQEIDKLYERLQSLRPLSPSIMAKLREYEVVYWTHHSAAIEGNTLSLKETRVVLEGLTVGGKTLREHLEIIDHRDAIEFLENCVEQSTGLTEKMIRQIHYLVLKSSDPSQAGRYRTGQVLIAGGRHKPPTALDVPVYVQELLNEYNSLKMRGSHPVERAAWLHWRLVWIHPFTDGNGRTARLLMNFSLMKDGFPPAVIEKRRRKQYLDALEVADTESNLSPFTLLIAKAVKDSLKRYVAAAET